MKLPSLRGIEAFLTTADLGSVRAAAAALNLTVSAVSHRIQTLEAEIGNKLFDRRGQKLLLTPLGARYREELLPPLAAVQKATVRTRALPAETRLRIASVPLFYSHWLVPRLGRFVAKFPALELELLSMSPRKSVEADITLRPSYRADGAPGEEKLFSWEVTPVCHPDLVSRYKLREPVDLMRAVLIDLPSPLHAWSRWLSVAGMSDNAGLRWLKLDSFPLAYDAAVEGLGVAISATAFTQHYPPETLVQPFPLLCGLPGGMFMNPAPDSPGPVVAAFREWLIAEARAPDPQRKGRPAA